MKTELTTTQKDFLEFLSGEFNKLNQTEKNKPFNVIDINALNHDMNAIEVAKNELAIFNSGVMKLQNESIIKFVELMNEDFKNAKFPVLAVVRNHSDGFGIDVEYEKMKERSGSEIYGYIIKLEAGKEMTQLYHGLHSLGYRIDKFHYKTKWDAPERFDTPQKFFDNAEIQKKLLNLIKVSMNLKEFGTINPKK